MAVRVDLYQLGTSDEQIVHLLCEILRVLVAVANANGVKVEVVD